MTDETHEAYRAAYKAGWEQRDQELRAEVERWKRIAGTSNSERAANAEAEVERLRAALERIKRDCGRVCDEFELCQHRACQSSYEAWAIADAGLQGETPESANAKALARSKEC